MTAGAITKDAADCASYLVLVRSGDNWTRFDVAVDDFLMRHTGEKSLATLRQHLAAAYQAVAPSDAEAHQRILNIIL